MVTLSRTVRNLNPMAPPFEWKRFRSLGEYSSSLDMNFDSRCTVVIWWNPSWIYKTNDEPVSYICYSKQLKHALWDGNRDTSYWLMSYRIYWTTSRSCFHSLARPASYSPERLKYGFFFSLFMTHFLTNATCRATCSPENTII